MVKWEYSNSRKNVHCMLAFWHIIVTKTMYKGNTEFYLDCENVADSVYLEQATDWTSAKREALNELFDIAYGTILNMTELVRALDAHRE